MDKGKLKPLTGLKLKKAARTLATLGLSVVLMLGATFGISSCAPKISSPSGQTPPITPVEPNQPSTPVKPENPGSTQTPENPQNPNTPSQPDDPVEPNNPDTPQNPDDPTTPENPTNPDDPQNPDQPDDPDDPGKQPEEQKPIEPEFELNAQTKAVIAEKLKPTMEKMIYSFDKKWTSPNLLQAYLRKDTENSRFVDTIGCVMTANEGQSFLYSEIVIYNLTSDITWEQLYKTGITLEKYTSSTCGRRKIYASTNTITTLSEYDQSYFVPAFKKAFGLEEFSPLWAGLTYSGGIVDAAYDFTYIKDNVIYTKEVIVNKNGNGLFNAFVENYLNAKSDSNWYSYISSEDTLIKVVPYESVVNFTNQENEAETV